MHIIQKAKKKIDMLINVAGIADDAMIIKIEKEDTSRYD